MKKERKAYIASCDISEIRTYPLGGFSQKVLVEGRRKDAPIVITLHGGPGSPFPFNAGCRGLFPAFTDHFIMVCWDQLGCGINNHAIDNSFTPSHFADMTADLVRCLRADFPDNPIYLFGMSCGSILTAMTAAQPGLVDGVLVWGQILRMPNCSDAAFDALEQAIPERLRPVLGRIRNTAPPELGKKDLMKLSLWLRKYTEGFQSKTGEKAGIGPIVLGVLQSPDYSLRDFGACFINSYQKNTSLVYAVARTDLRDTLRQIAVPYWILQGEKDLVTATEDVTAFVDSADSDKLRLEIIPDNSHMPGKSGMEAVLSHLLRLTNAR